MDEFEFIRRISESIPRTAEGLIKGIDDDAAVIEGPRGQTWLITTDIFAEGVHFERDWADRKTLGRKALLVNISDIAAMGGIPWFYFVSVSCPGDMGEKEILDLFAGMNDVALKHAMILAGGDTTASKKGLFISITVVGCMEKENIVYRNGARENDHIYVSGLLGGSTAGLHCLKNGISGKVYRKFILRHLTPEPRLTLGRWLAENRCASSMIDISDGLIADLGHVSSKSGVGYQICADDVPLFGGLDGIAGRFGMGVTDMALCGGEEYELLFTMNSEQEREFLAKTSRMDFGCKITKIGGITGDPSFKKVLNRGGKGVRLRQRSYAHKIGRKN